MRSLLLSALATCSFALVVMPHLPANSLRGDSNEALFVSVAKRQHSSTSAKMALDDESTRDESPAAYNDEATRDVSPPADPAEEAAKRMEKLQAQAKPSDDDRPRMTREGLAAFRERQRLKAGGAPQKVWSENLEPDDDPERLPRKQGDGYTAPTQDQTEAMNTLFESALTSERNLPDTFGEGIDDLV